MSDALVLRSVLSLMDSSTTILWSNKYVCPSGYNYNDDGYVITNRPLPFVRACIGLSFGFLIKLLGLKEYVRQNVIALRLLNGDVHKAILSEALWNGFKRSGLLINRELYDSVVAEVFLLNEVPLLNSNFLSWRSTWFSRECDYDTVSKVVRQENDIKIDSDRELMTVDKKYVTADVVEFTGFSRSKIDRYWAGKEWTKQLRTLYTIDEAVTELAKKGVTDPSRSDIAEVSGLSINTISRSMKEIKKMIGNNKMLMIDEK